MGKEADLDSSLEKHDIDERSHVRSMSQWRRQGDGTGFEHQEERILRRN